MPELDPAIVQLQKLRAKRVELARTDIVTLASMILTDDAMDKPFPNRAPLHATWQELAKNYPRLIVVAPTGSGKASQLIVVRCIAALAKNPKVRIVIAGAVQEAAQRLLLKIEHLIDTSPAVHEIFPNLKAGKLWSGEKMNVLGLNNPKTPNIRALGVGTPYESGYIDLLLLHNPCTSENSGTPKERAGVLEWYRQGLEVHFRKDARVIITGQPLHKEDLIGLLSADKTFVVRKFPVRDKEGRPTIPEIWPEERIAESERAASHNSALERDWRRRMMMEIGEDRQIPPLMEFIPYASPLLDKPLHLKPVVDTFEDTQHRPVRVIIAAPRQFGKSFTVMHGLVWVMLRTNKCHIYATHTQDMANVVSRRTQDLCRRLGATVEGPLNHWRVGGSEIKFVGIGSALVGNKADGIFIIDDALKDREQADNLAERDKITEWYESVASPCIHPGASRVLLATRWHEDDQSARFIASGLCQCLGECICDKWHYISLPAINDVGESLWPEKRPISFLRKMREDMTRDGTDREWQAQMMQNPRSKSSRIFEGGARPTYTELPKALRIGIGVDMAYSGKKRSDHSCAVVVGEHEGYYYLISVAKKQCRAPEFKEDLAGLRQMYPLAPMRWHGGGGGETGVGDFLNLADPLSNLTEGIGIEVLSARGSKQSRADASGFTTAWNKGRFLIPAQMDENIVWFVRIVLGFTGAEGNSDDALDAGSSSVSTLVSGASTPDRNPPAYGTPEYWRLEEQKAIDRLAAKFQSGSEENSDGWQSTDARSERSRAEYE